jgi:uncharacterized membrane protein YkoI
MRNDVILNMALKTSRKVKGEQTMTKRNLTPIKHLILPFICALAILLSVGADEAFAAAKTSGGTSINAYKAKSIALADAKVSSASAKNIRCESDYENGILVFEVEYEANGSEYEYDIKASDGTILKKSVKSASSAKAKNNAKITATLKQLKSVSMRVAAKRKASRTSLSSVNASSSSANTSRIGVDKAKSIALKHAGKAASEVSFTKAKLDNDDGKAVYDVEFRSGQTEYEYEIDAASGKILEYDIDRD